MQWAEAMDEPVLPPSSQHQQQHAANLGDSASSILSGKSLVGAPVHSASWSTASRKPSSCAASSSLSSQSSPHHDQEQRDYQRSQNIRVGREGEIGSPIGDLSSSPHSPTSAGPFSVDLSSSSSSPIRHPPLTVPMCATAGINHPDAIERCSSLPSPSRVLRQIGKTGPFGTQHHSPTKSEHAKAPDAVSEDERDSGNTEEPYSRARLRTMAKQMQHTGMHVAQGPGQHTLSGIDKGQLLDKIAGTHADRKSRPSKGQHEDFL